MERYLMCFAPNLSFLNEGLILYTDIENRIMKFLMLPAGL